MQAERNYLGVCMKSKLIVCVAAGALLLNTVSAHAVAPLATNAAVKVPLWFKVVGIGVMVCATGLISSAWAKSIQTKKELTPQEASTCGFSYFWRPRP